MKVYLWNEQYCTYINVFFPIGCTSQLETFFFQKAKQFLISNSYKSKNFLFNCILYDSSFQKINGILPFSGFQITLLNFCMTCCWLLWLKNWPIKMLIWWDSLYVKSLKQDLGQCSNLCFCGKNCTLMFKNEFQPFLTPNLFNQDNL